MSDLVERMRRAGAVFKEFHEAADEIERLRSALNDVSIIVLQYRTEHQFPNEWPKHIDDPMLRVQHVIDQLEPKP